MLEFHQLWSKQSGVALSPLESESGIALNEGYLESLDVPPAGLV